MDGYSGPSAQDYFPIDDLLDFSNEDIFSSSSNDSVNHHHIPPPPSAFIHPVKTDFTDDFCLPSEDVAELEWLSQFVDDSDLPGNTLTMSNGGGAATTLTIRSDTSPFTSKTRTKRSKAPSNWTSDVKPHSFAAEGDGGSRRCTHCASEKTPQWRTGPLGPKTLCNACGVRFKSGRLVPEYRPASSPTFVLTQHSNSHRKVLELRRQKEMFKQHQQQRPSSEEMQMYHRRRSHHHHDFEVC